MKSVMERILGAKIQSTADLGLDGLQGRHGDEVIFFAVPEAEQPEKVFRKLTNATNPPTAKSGGATEYGCSIETSDGSLYHALTVHGDVKGWRKDIELGAAQLELSLAKVKGNKFVVDGGQVFEVSDCIVKFF